MLAWLGDPRSHRMSDPVRRIDTQGAVVFLAGANAYKIRRPIRLPFLDYSTLEKRRAACEAEIALNRESAPGVYLAAAPITRQGESFAFGGSGEVVEWASHMRRFDENATLDRLAELGDLNGGLIDDLAKVIHAEHERAPLRPAAPAIRSLDSYLDQNEAAFAGRPDLFAPERAAELTRRARVELAALRPLLLARGDKGFVRRCHGDLHLRNIAVIRGRPVPFDAIEFDEAIATGDLLYDLAFAIMDLWERGLRPEANRLLNGYLAQGDETAFSGLAALPFFLSLRAAIRAKVEAANLSHLHGEALTRTAGAARRYFEFAVRFLEPAPARLVAIGGFVYVESADPLPGPPAGLAPHRALRAGVVHAQLFVRTG